MTDVLEEQVGSKPDSRRHCVSSPQCRAAASSAFAEVTRRLRAGEAARAALRTELGACASLDRAEDRAELLGALQALVGGAVQYDGQAGAPLSVRQLCGLLQARGKGRRPAPYRGLRQAVQVSSPAPGAGRRTSAARPWVGETPPELLFPPLSHENDTAQGPRGGVTRPM